MEITNPGLEQWGALLFEVHVRVYEHYTALNMWAPDESPVDMDNPEEVAALMARARQKMAS